MAAFVPNQKLPAAQLNSSFAAKADQSALLTVSATAGSAAAGVDTINNGTAAPAGPLTGSEIITVSRGAGALRTTLTNIAQWALSAYTIIIVAGVGAVARTIISKFNDFPVTPQDFGAVGDGVTNDDAALTAWLAALTMSRKGYLPAGIYKFTTPKVAPLLNNIAIAGAGSRQSIFLYAGASTTADLFTIGDGTTSLTGWNLQGFSLTSNTVMSAGYALRIRRMQSGSEIIDVEANNTTNLFNGVYLDNVNICKYERANISCQNVGLSMSGSATSDEGSDIYLEDIVTTFCGTGFLVGGGQGGVYFGKTLGFGNRVNYKIDNSLKARPNREFLFSSQSVSDGCIDYGIWINDTLTNSAPISLDAWVGSAGLIGSGGIGVNIYVQSWPSGRITMGAGQLFNATSHGLRVDDVTTVIDIDQARQIFNNGGWGIFANAGTGTNIRFQGRATNNTLGNFSPNTNLAPGALTLPGGWSGTTAALNKNGRYTIQGLQSQAHATIAQYSVVATVPVGYRPAVQVPAVVYFSGGSASDGSVIGRINTDGTIQVLQAVGDTANLQFIATWDNY